jgi:hypothetical protein
MHSTRHHNWCRRFEDAVLLGLLLVLPSGCRAKADAGRQPGVIDASGSDAMVVPLLNHGDDETLVTTVSGRESFTCTAAQQTERPTERPCRRFSILAHRRGTLSVRLRWDDGHPLLIAVTTADGVPIETNCCRSPQVLTLPVQAASAYELQIMLMTAWGREEHQRFELTTSLEF